jgi:hypothetical protein
VLGPGGNFTFVHIDAEHPGSTLPAFELNGNSQTGIADLPGTSIHGMYLENGACAANTQGLKIVGAHGVSAFGVACSNGYTPTHGDNSNCIEICGTNCNLGQSGSFNLTFANMYNNGYQYTVNNRVDETQSVTATDFPLYTYAGTSGSNTFLSQFDRIGISSGISQGPGLKHQRFDLTASGACSISGTVQTCALSWNTPPAFGDSNYTVTCTLEGTGFGQSPVVQSKSAAGFSLQISGLSSIAGSADCIGIHD